MRCNLPVLLVKGEFHAIYQKEKEEVRVHCHLAVVLLISLSKSKSISPIARVREYLDEALCVSASKLFCQACREELSLKKSVIINHLKSNKGKEKLKAKQKRARDIAESLRKYTEEIHPVGETLPENV